MRTSQASGDAADDCRVSSKREGDDKVSAVQSLVAARRDHNKPVQSFGPPKIAAVPQWCQVPTHATGDAEVSVDHCEPKTNSRSRMSVANLTAFTFLAGVYSFLA